MAELDCVILSVHNRFYWESPAEFCPRRHTLGMFPNQVLVMKEPLSIIRS